MKPISVILFFFLIVCYSNRLIGQMLEGRIMDQHGDAPIEYASITLFNAIDSSFIDGVVSEEDGRFRFDKIPKDSVYFKAQFLGYQQYISELFLTKKAMDIGDIYLSIDAIALDQVEVTGRELTTVYKLDKQVFDAKQFQAVQGGSASDVIGNLPSVSLNSFGEISVRGTSGFLVMVNGRPLQTDPMTILNQLPANAIEDIEIITTPSAKYDPDGNAGIINIKTKRNTTDGFFLLANTLIGLPSIEDYDNAENTPRYGADITLNHKKGKWEFASGLDYRRYDISGRREGYVNTYLNNVLTEFPSDGERSFDEENYSARLSTVFTPDDHQSFSAGFYFGKRTKERTADILYSNQQRSIIPGNQFLGTEAYFELYEQSRQVFSGGEILNTLTYFNENLRVRRGDFVIGSLSYSYSFPNKATLSVSGLYERTQLGGPTDNVNLDYPNVAQIRQLQFNTNDNPLDGYRFQIDYAHNLGATKIETGYQFRFLKHPGDFDYFDRDLENDVWVENPLFTNSIELQRTIHSLYGQASGKLGQLSYTGGLRFEHFDREVDIASPANTFLLDQFNIFPSLNLNYDLDNEWKLKGGYSRRIERTTTFKMTPFPEREHSETLEQGDAELLPEYIDLVEIGVAKNWGDNVVFGTLYYRHVNNLINRVNTVFNDTILNRIYTNVGEANIIGFELGTTLYPTKWSRVFFGGNVYNYDIQGQLFGDAIDTSKPIFSINTTFDFQFSPSFKGQLALNYLSERVTAQGRDSRFYNPSLSLQKQFLDNKLTIGLQWRNIDLGLLDANEQRITTVREQFFTTTNYVYEVDIVQLTVSYQINQLSKRAKLLDSEFGKKEF